MPAELTPDEAINGDDIVWLRVPEGGVVGLLREDAEAIARGEYPPVHVLPWTHGELTRVQRDDLPNERPVRFIDMSGAKTAAGNNREHLSWWRAEDFARPPHNRAQRRARRKR